MYSGKSEELIRRVRRALIARRNVQVFKSHPDDRYGGIGRVSSHDGGTVEGIPVSTSREVAERITPLTHVVAIDEVQFLDAGIIQVVNSLADEGLRVIVSGTDMDFRGQPFGPMPALLAIAEQVDKLHALRDLWGARDAEPAPDRRKSCTCGRTDHPGGRQRKLRGAVPAMPCRASGGSVAEGT